MPDVSRSADVTPAIEIRDVKKSFGAFHAIESLDLTVAEGEFLSLLGPSGCGKSTLLRMIAGFTRPDAGRILVSGRDVTDLPPERRPTNMVFQRYALFPHLSIADNVGYGLRRQGWGKREIGARVAEMLNLVSLSGFGQRLPSEISGGQAQRVALARALAPSPTVLLLDEPLSALDRAVRGDLQKQLARIHAETGTTFLYVTHDQEEAMSLSTRIALMDKGSIVQLGPPHELYRRPHNDFAARFVGDINILTCRVRNEPGQREASWEGITFGLDRPGASGGEELQCVFRPEDLRLVPPGVEDRRSLPVEPVSSSYHGFYWMHEVRVIGTEHLLMVRDVAHESAAATGQLRVLFPTAGVRSINGSR
ncbi:ABC transporter ATP-binding protein [Nocardioides sp. AN3]